MGSDIDPRRAGSSRPQGRTGPRKRVPCLVPFCLRSIDRERLATRGDAEWICGKHWSGVPPQLRTIYRRARAAERRAAAVDEAARQQLLACPEAQVFRAEGMHPVEEARWRTVNRHVAAGRRTDRLWTICKRHAIETAGGIGP